MKTKTDKSVKQVKQVKPIKPNSFTPKCGTNIARQDMAKEFNVKQFAIIKKTYWMQIDNMPPLAIHNYLKISKGTIVGLIDEIIDINEFKNDFFTNNIHVYVINNNILFHGLIPIKIIKLIK